MHFAPFTDIKKAIRRTRERGKMNCLQPRASEPRGFSEDTWSGLKSRDLRSNVNDAKQQLVKSETSPLHKHAGYQTVARAGTYNDLDVTSPVYEPCYQHSLRTRLLNAGHEAMPELELLELLLFNVFCQNDSRPLAKRLMLEFGDLNGVISASKYRVLRVQGSNEWVYYHLRIVEAFARRMSLGKLRERNVLSSWDALITYCRTAMAHQETEQFRVFYLDRKNVLISDEAQAQKTEDHVPVYPREVAKRALELNASAIIVVHNHPSGDPTPSCHDEDMTVKLLAACEAIGVTVHDHVVIGKEREFSFMREGWL